MSLSLLLAEDDARLRLPLIHALRTEGYEVKAVTDGVAALAHVHDQCPDIVLLGAAIPHLSGAQVCRVLRAEGNWTPILMLTARAAAEDRIVGLEAGADDYVVNPFDMKEVLVRIRALQRRTLRGTTPFDRHLLQVGDLTVDAAARTVHRAEHELDLTRIEFNVLELLARNTGIVLDHATIRDRIWGHDFGAEPKDVAVCIGCLRRKVDTNGMPPLVHTVHDVGYVLRP